jgi:hypothetical protein
MSRVSGGIQYLPSCQPRIGARVAPRSKGGREPPPLCGGSTGSIRTSGTMNERKGDKAFFTLNRCRESPEPALRGLPGAPPLALLDCNSKRHTSDPRG